MRAAEQGDADGAAAGDVERRAAVMFHAADPTGPDGDVVLPSAILSDGRGVILPAGEIGLFAGSGGSGKSRLSLQVGVAAAGVPAGTAEPIPDGTLRVASGPVVLCSYEDAAPWIAWRARRVARWLDDRAGTTYHTLAVTDPERLSVAAVDAPLFGVTLGAGREAIPGPLASWRPLWDHSAAIGARLVIIDPVALAGQWDGYSPLPVGAFIAAIRRELRTLTDPCGAVLVCHTTKAARFGVQAADRTGAEAIIGSAAWVDRARARTSARTGATARRRPGASPGARASAEATRSRAAGSRRASSPDAGAGADGCERAPIRIIIASDLLPRETPGTWCPSC